MLKNIPVPVPVFRNLPSHLVTLPMSYDDADYVAHANINYLYAFGIIVKDDSMEDNYFENDVLICVEADEQLKDGSFVVAIIKSKKEVITNARHISYNEDGSIYLYAAKSAKYPPQLYKKEEIVKIYMVAQMTRMAATIENRHILDESIFLKKIKQ